MLNQFYNYISEIILSYLKKVGVKAGDRYYLQLDNDEEVENLINVLKAQENVEAFHYKHELGEEYRTFCIMFNNVKFVIANTTANVKPDFLVTLRNQVGEQKDVWANTAMLSIVSEQLDSIEGGSSNLQKEGMPLHSAYLHKQLKDRIEDSVENKVDQIILHDHLDNIMQEQSFRQITFFDFEDIFITLNKGSISDNEYKNFGLFKDSELASFKGKEQERRLENNKELFDFVRRIHDYGFEDDEYEKKFLPDDAKQFKEENWQEINYTEVNKLHDKFKKNTKKTKVEFKEVSIKDKLTIWDKPHRDTAPGRRKRQIIIFNPEQKDEIELQAAFTIQGMSKSLSTEFLTVPKSQDNHANIKVGKTNIYFNIQPKKDKCTFIKAQYKHDKKVSLGAEFQIAILPIEPYCLDRYKTSYNVEAAKGFIELQYESEKLIFGDGLQKQEVEIVSENESVILNEDQQLIIIPQSEAFNDEDTMQLRVQFQGITVPFLLKNELPESTPITGQRLWRLKRENKQSFEWIDESNRLVLGNREFYLHAEYKDYFYWEKEWIDKGYRSAEVTSDKLLKVEVDLSDEMRESYSRFLTFFKVKSSIPSLTYMSSELIERAREYIQTYINEIKDFEEESAAGKKGRELFKLGTIESNGILYFTPFHPINVAFQMKITEMLLNEEVDNNILNRLVPNALVPFVYNSKEQLYKPDSQLAAPEWMVFKPVNQVSVSDANQFLSKVVQDKLMQFKEHFSYLFIEHSSAPLKVNVINISNDLEVLKGIINWMLKVIEKEGTEQLKPIEVTLYSEDSTSSFDLFSRIDSVDEFYEKININLKKIKEYEPQDLLRIIREKLFFYRQSNGIGYNYAHISYYKMHAQEKDALQTMKDMYSGISLDGLYSSVPSMKGKEIYKSGFGIKAYNIESDNVLTSIAYFFNELVANLRNGGNDNYRKGEAIFSRTTTANEDVLKSIFSSSYWVTFIDPNIDLDFFNSYDGNLVVIHYSDQYSSSSRYDAITVTDKSQQYYAVIKEFLKKKDVEGSDENVRNTIKAFNTFNGEWLLRIIGSKGHYDREKLSIVSAIKFSLAYFDHKNILWVHISLEEVLRIAGAVSLNRSDGVFTASNLGVKGSHSDDLLLIGLENNNEELFLHFYPIEVKVGINQSDVLEKARKQVTKTKKLFLETLSDKDENTFTSLFYRNFFVQLFISNAKKIKESGLWGSKEYHLVDELIEKLLKDQYQINNHLVPYIGEGAIVSFQKDLFHRSAHLEDNISILSLTENDGYNGLVQSIEQMHNWIQREENDFIREDMLSYQYNGDVVSIDKENDPNPEPITLIDKENHYDVNESNNEENFSFDDPDPVDETENIEVITGTDPDENNETASNFMGEEESESDELKQQIVNLEETRILIGKAENSNRNIYWEYGNKGLANRHLLISGKSGQGKTYFMQCLLLEKSKQGIPSIVIDYTEGFLPNQLEPEFVGFLGDKLKQQIVFSEKLPINPFKKNIRDIGGITLPETNTDVAERIKSVFSSVYSTLGIQQLNAIYDAIINGLERYDERMDLLKLKEILEEDGSNYAKTALSQIRPFIDRNPFRNEDMKDWSDVVNSNGEVFVIQLTGFPRDVQLMITEFILWDLWNYSVRFGNKNNPMPVIMDEAQNLDHTEKSPSARILTEGRKFGWSAWYATQFLKSQLDADELARLQNASEKIYFAPPEQEVSSIAASLSKDATEKKKWESALTSLKKGQCIVHGPILDDRGELTKPIITVVDIISLSGRT